MPYPNRMVRKTRSAKKILRKRSTRRALRRRRITRKRQQGGEIPDDLNTIVDYRDGNDIDSVATPMSKEVFDETSTAAPETAI